VTTAPATVGEWLARFDAALIVAPAARRALCDELAAHFADALADDVTEATATSAVGAPEQVAEACSREANLAALQRGVWLLIAGVLALGAAWYVGILVYPLGQWVKPPAVLYAPHHLGLGAWAATGVLGGGTLLALRSPRLLRRHDGLALAAAIALVAMLVLHVVAGNLYVWLRNGIVPGSPAPEAQLALSAAHLAIAAVVAAPLATAAGRLRRVAGLCRSS
jgi:hypothetical protein